MTTPSVLNSINMDSFISRVIIANSYSADKVEKLRSEAYHNSNAFKIVDEDDFMKHYKWNKNDECGIVLLALSDENEPLSCLRGNIYFTADELEANNCNFTNNSKGFISFPVLDMTFAATSPNNFQNGVLSVLRYYMYILHKHSVKSISGAAVKNTSIYQTLEKLGYEFKEIGRPRKYLSPVNAVTIARLDILKIDVGISYLKKKYSEAIKKYPLIIT